MYYSSRGHSRFKIKILTGAKSAMIFQRLPLFCQFFDFFSVFQNKIFFFAWHLEDYTEIHVLCFYNFLSDEVGGQHIRKSILHFSRGHKIEIFIFPPRGVPVQKNFGHELGVCVSSK